MGMPVNYLFEDTRNFEDHVTPNKREYQKSVWTKLRYCLGVSYSPSVNLLIACLVAKEIEFEIGHFPSTSCTTF